MPTDPEFSAITKRATIDLVAARGRPTQELYDRLYLIGLIHKAEVADAGDVGAAIAGSKRQRRKSFAGADLSPTPGEPGSEDR
ncbi:MAG: hypothetical protein ACREJS_07000 [Candidatus Rokuibacteriota bacterium]